MKNLFKKIGALLVAAVMVLSMCTAVFADDTTKATITVKTPDGDLVLGGSDNTTIWCVQVIEPDPTTETGWKFSNGVESAFTSNFGNNVEAQTAIKMLANKAAQDNGQTLKYANVAVATSAQFENALAAVNVTDANKVKKNPINVNKAGVYAIKVAQSGYTYKEMAAYVGFSDNMVVEGNVDIDAKRSSKVINKGVKEDLDHVVAIGDIKTYTVETEVPAFTPTDANKYFAVKDVISGAEYVKAENSNDVAVNVKVDGNEVSDYRIVMGEGTFTIILKDNRANQTVDAKVNNEPVINESNSYYAKKLVVTYQAKITDVTATNKAYGNVGNDEKFSTPVNLYTGTIKVIKKETNSDKLLPNAKFVVYRMNDDKKEYAKLINGKLAGWTEAVNKDYDVKPDIKNGNTKKIGIIETDAKGEATVSGLDLGDYYFEEVEAPTGYSLDATPNKVTVTLKENVKEASATKDVISEPLTKYNTTLNSLPSTGGMGTYLFTIIGVVVMAGAAGAFFISRRKGSEE